MVKLISIPSFLVLTVAFVVGGRLYRPVPKWHEGEKWETLLRIYDEIAEKDYQDCDSRLLLSKFGDTHVFVCGSPEKNPPVVLFHGISANSLMFGEWIVPKLSQTHYTVAVDTLCDMGRSRPTNGDPSNCPQTQEEVAEWVNELFVQLNIKQASLIGYSFGCFLASCVAMKAPELVDKMILMAPAAVFAPFELSWLARAITVGMLGSIVGWESEYAEKLRLWFFGYMTTQDPSVTFQKCHPELRTATGAVGMAQVGVRPVVYSVESLRAMNERNPTLLAIGKEETVIDANVAIETATQAGIKVKVYPDAGHMLNAEYPRDGIIDVVASFLDTSD